MEVIDVKGQVRAIFDPLASRLGLRGPAVKDHTYSDFSLYYWGDGIGIEVDVEQGGFFIYVMLFLPKGFAIPKVYQSTNSRGYLDETGALQALLLQQALKELGIDISKETKELRKLKGHYHNCTAIAEIQAQLLEQNWHSISSDPSRWFK